MYGITSFTFVMVSILGFTLETIPAFSDKTPLNVSCNGHSQKALLSYMTPRNALNILDIICTVFFSLELIARFIFSPNKLTFVRSPMNIIDLLALVPLYFQMTIAATKTEHCYLNEKFLIEIMFILRIIRMFRIFHLVKHYQALKILVYALKASIQELLMLSIFLIIGMLVFASMIYYAERQDASKSQNSKFTTIPMGFWWAIVTMTTVGYGDVYPTTVIGYFVGTGCAVSGVLLLALTIPVISNNFTLFYSHVRSKRDISKATSISEVYNRDNGHEPLVSGRKNSTESVTIDNFTPMLLLPVNPRQQANKDVLPMPSFSGTKSMMDIVLTSHGTDIDLHRSSSMHSTNYNGKNTESII